MFKAASCTVFVRLTVCSGVYHYLRVMRVGDTSMCFRLSHTSTDTTFLSKLTDYLSHMYQR